MPQENHPGMTRRSFLWGGTRAAIALAGGVTLLSACGRAAPQASGPIEIGGISDLTGPLAPLGQSQKQMVELAVEDINARGGLLGRQLSVKYVDGASDPATWANRVRELASLPMIIGGLTSAERDAIKQAATRNSIYIWPQLTEGIGECDARMFSTGPVPEQQILPFVDFLIETAGDKRFYFLGNDYNFPRAVNAAAIAHLTAQGGEVLGEDYFPLDATDFSSAVNRIASTGPAVVFSNVIPPSSFALLRQINEAGLWQNIVFATPGSDESWLFGIDREQIAGMYSCMDFYQSLDDEMTQSIIKAYQEKFNGEPPISAAGGATGAYRGVQLWAEAVTKANSLDPKAVEEAMQDVATDRAPGGRAEMVPGTRHAKVPTYIGRFTTETIEVVKAITPVPAPTQCL